MAIEFGLVSMLVEFRGPQSCFGVAPVGHIGDERDRSLIRGAVGVQRARADHRPEERAVGASDPHVVLAGNPGAPAFEVLGRHEPGIVVEEVVDVTSDHVVGERHRGARSCGD